MRKLLRLSKMLLVAVGMLAGANSAWAGDVTTLYERGTTNSWTDADLTDWSGSTTNTTYKIDGGLYIGNEDPGNTKISFSTGKTIAATENSIVTMTAVVSMGLAANRNTSYDYLKIGGTELRVYGTGGASNACISQVYIDGVAQGDAVSGTRGGIYTFNVEIDQATKAVKYSVSGGSTIEETSSTTNTAITNVVIGHSRGGAEGGAGHHICLSKIDISEEVQAVTMAGYTVKYKCGGDEIKEADTSRSGVVGTFASLTASDKASFFNDGATKKYIYVSDDSESNAIGGDGSTVITVTFREAETFSYTVNAVDGSNNILRVLTTGSAFEEDQISADYPRFILSGTNLLASGTGAVTYSTTFTPDQDSYVKNIVYDTETIANVAYFTEGEDVEGAEVGANAARASMGKMGHTGGAEVYKDVTTLAPGNYIIYMRGQNGNSAARAFNFKVGADVVFNGSIANGTNSDQNSEKFTVTTASTLSFASEGSSQSGVDYFYIVKTAVPAEITSAGWSTLYTDYALDFSAISVLTAYTATCDGSKVTLTKVENVPAGTGVVLKGAANTYDIPVIASSATAKGDLKGSTTETKTYDTANNYYYLALNGKEAQFKKLAEGGSIAAGKAYLQLSISGAPSLNIDLGGTTGINAVQGSEFTVNGEYYNLAGQRVAQPTKGLYIVNGKKVVVK